MALITCPDCQASISDAAPACPKCGRPAGAPTPAAPATAPVAVAIAQKAPPLDDGLLWVYLKTVSVRTWRIAMTSAVGATIVFVAWACWYFREDRTIRRHQAQFMAENCYGIHTMTECEALIATRNEEARRQRQAAASPSHPMELAVAPLPMPAPASVIRDVGEVVALDGQTPVFLTRNDFDTALGFAVVQDLDGFTRVATKRSMICAEGTRVKLLESDGTAYRVRILSGPFARAAGWVTPSDLRSE